MRKRGYEGTLTLEQTSTKVIEFEQTGWEVLGWGIENDKNVVQFEPHQGGLFPTPCLFRRKRLSPLPGFEEVGSGKMLENGQTVEVVLYRWRS